MHGFLNLYKPAGITSRKAVNQITKTLKPVSKKIKVGHTGTLDPMATGVLVIGIGKATSLIRWLLQGDKKYTGTFLLGHSSPSEDTQTEMTSHPIPESLDSSSIENSFQGFLGKIEQIPPAYSALHVNGKRAYELARKGEQVVLKPRPIEIYDLRLRAYNPQESSFQIDVHCSGGTYIRSLGRDIAANLGTHAVMSALERTGAGPFSKESSIPLEQLDSVDSIQKSLQPCDLALKHLPKLQIKQVDSERFAGGLVTYQLADELFHFWESASQLTHLSENSDKQTVLIDNENHLIGVVQYRQHTERAKSWVTVVNLAGRN